MSDEELPPEAADVDEVNLQLDQGLQSCRAVVANYRTLLANSRTELAENDNECEDENYPEAR